MREVREETGLEVKILSYYDAIFYAFTRAGERIEKTVHYFHMEPVGGDLSAHDHEFDEVRWVSLADASHLLTFPTERSLVEQTAASLPGRLPSPGAGAGQTARETGSMSHPS